jgi:hypothetical protein
MMSHKAGRGYGAAVGNVRTYWHSSVHNNVISAKPLTVFCLISVISRRPRYSDLDAANCQLRRPACAMCESSKLALRVGYLAHSGIL